MQTFVPCGTNFTKSAACLDRQRLGKQRVEVLQILKSIRDGKGWINHPATKMWIGYEPALAYYGFTICNEWTYRGYKDTCKDKIYDIACDIYGDTTRFEMPPWLFDGSRSSVAWSHKSNLIRKDPEHYHPYFGDLVPDNLEYVWPV